MQVKPIKINNQLQIDEIYTIHYFEFSVEYDFKGEQHDFYELIYVDKGCVNIMVDQKGIILNQGEAILVRPMRFHILCSNGQVAPNLTVISFDLKMNAEIDIFDKPLIFDKSMRNSLAMVMDEAYLTFDSKLNDPKTTSYILKDKGAFGSLQKIGILIELIIIELIRNEKEAEAYSPDKAKIINEQNHTFKSIVDYMMENIYTSLSISDLLSYSNISSSSLYKLFKDCSGMSATSYFRWLKIQEAKKIIREQNLNMSQIAYMLGFSSVHYFSRCFKTHTLISPIQYKNSIRSMQNTRI